MNDKQKQPVFIGWYDHNPEGRRMTAYDGANEYGEVLPSMTKQSFKDECDINNILSQYKQSGIISHINAQAAAGRYIDLPESVDLQEAFALVEQATGAFASLPAKVRDRFHNDPALFLAFCEDPKNADELVELGLREPPSRPPADPPQEDPPAPPKA